MVKWGKTFMEMDAEKLTKQQKKNEKKDWKEMQNDREVHKGYQRWYAWFPIRLDCGRWIWREEVYRHRKFNQYATLGNGWHWQYIEDDDSFRFHVVQDMTLEEMENSEYVRSKCRGEDIASLHWAPRCPKCKSRPSKEEFHYGEFDSYTYGKKYTGKHWHRECSKCHHEWVEDRR